MAANLLQWFISTGARNAGLTQQEYTARFYPGGRQAQASVGAAFGANNNGKSLFTQARKSSSGWQSCTLPAARSIEADARAAAEALEQACPPDFFQKMQHELPKAFAARPEYACADYAGSRLRVWMDGLAQGTLGGAACAHMLARIFAEIVLSLEDGGLRQGGGAVTAELAERACSGRTAGEERPVAGNLRMTGRRRLEAENNIVDRLTGASKVQMLNITAIGLIYGRERADRVDPKRAIFENCLSGGTEFEVILPMPGSLGEADAGTFKLRQGYFGRSGMDMVALTRERLLEDMEIMKKRGQSNRISLFFTECALPYALMIVTFKDAPARDHIKVDLLSPYLRDDLSRRSFYIYRDQDPDNYGFFLQNYQDILRQSTSCDRLPASGAAQTC